MRSGAAGGLSGSWQTNTWQPFWGGRKPGQSSVLETCGQAVMRQFLLRHGGVSLSCEVAVAFGPWGFFPKIVATKFHWIS